MPWIIVAPDEHSDPRSSALLQERVSLSDFESDHFSAQLIERLGWAVVDADEHEHPPAGRSRRPAPRERQHRAATRRREPIRT